MPKKRKSTKSRGRRYSDCQPHAPCADVEDTGRPLKAKSFSSIGPVAAGFDHYGYPIVRNFNLPDPFRLSDGRRYGALISSIKPMKLATVNPDGTVPLPKPGIARAPDFKLKPSPTVPGAPDSLPSQYKFCVQKGDEGYFFRFRNAKTSLHGAEANVISCDPDADGMIICGVQMPGQTGLTRAPLCEDPSSDKEPLSMDCCVRILSDESGQIVCPGAAYDMLIVKIVQIAIFDAIQIALVEHPDLPGGSKELPICEPIEEEPDERLCCIEEETGLIVCPRGISFPLAGKKIPLEYLEFVEGADGMRQARLRCGDINAIPPEEMAGNQTLNAMLNICEELGGYIFPACTRKPPKSVPRTEKLPPKFPDLCCYDPTTGTLVCEGTSLHGLAVEVVTESIVGGKPIVSVEHPNIPGGGARLPLCPIPPEIPTLPPADCCVVESSAGIALICNPSDHPWNGKDVTGLGQCIDTPNGRMCVLNITDEYGTNTIEVPVCDPPQIEIPPPSTEDIPPAPEPIPIPPAPEPRPPIRPPSRPPADGCDSTDAASCRKKWDEMVSKPAKLNRCDRKWLALLAKLRGGQGKPTPGRRASSLKSRDRARKYGTGIHPESLEYGRFPGLRGGRRAIR